MQTKEEECCLYFISKHHATHFICGAVKEQHRLTYLEQQPTKQKTSALHREASHKLTSSWVTLTAADSGCRLHPYFDSLKVLSFTPCKREHILQTKCVRGATPFINDLWLWLALSKGNDTYDGVTGYLVYVSGTLSNPNLLGAERRGNNVEYITCWLTDKGSIDSLGDVTSSANEPFKDRQRERERGNIPYIPPAE